MRYIVRHDAGDHLTGTVTGTLSLLSGRTTYLNAQGTRTGTVFSGLVTVDESTGAFDYTPVPEDYAISDVYTVEIEAVDDNDPLDRVTWPGGTFTIVDDIADAPVASSMVPSGGTAVGPATLDTRGRALGTLPIGAKVIAFLDTDAVASTVAASDGSWTLTLSGGATYTLKAVKLGMTTWTATVTLS